MMKFSAVILAILGLCFPLLTHAYSASGALKLHDATIHHARAIPLRINEHTYGDLSLYHSKANAVDSVRGGFSFSNDTKQKVVLKYRVILKDKKGIVAQTRGHIHLLPGHTQNIKMSNIVLRERDIKSINSVEVQFQD